MSQELSVIQLSLMTWSFAMPYYGHLIWQKLVFTIMVITVHHLVFPLTDYASTLIYLLIDTWQFMPVKGQFPAHKILSWKGPAGNMVKETNE